LSVWEEYEEKETLDNLSRADRNLEDLIQVKLEEEDIFLKNKKELL
jgi:hypothetical protein